MLSRILVVDDSSATRAFVRAILESQRACETVEEAENGVVALRVLARQSFDLAIVDINMPNIHGIDVIKMMRANPKHRTTPVLVISSEATAKDLDRGMAAGANAWLAKPFTPEQLATAVGALLARPPTGEGSGEGQAGASS